MSETIDDATMVHVGRLTELRGFYLGATLITDACLAQLDGLARLRRCVAASLRRCVASTS